MKIPTEYKTGNPGTDKLIAKQLAKEAKVQVKTDAFSGEIHHYLIEPSTKRDYTPRPGEPLQPLINSLTVVESVYTFNVLAMGKPRMTQRDKWKHREVVDRYYLYKDQLNAEALRIGFKADEILFNYFWLKFYLPMPRSWTLTQQRAMHGVKHRQKPDKDNLEKAFLDCLCKNDEFVADSRVSKYWCYPNEERVEVIIP